MWTAAVCPGAPDCMAVAAHVLTRPLLTDLRNWERKPTVVAHVCHPSTGEAEAGVAGRPWVPTAAHLTQHWGAGGRRQEAGG